jgi:hypothetical protein
MELIEEFVEKCSLLPFHSLNARQNPGKVLAKSLEQEVLVNKLFIRDQLKSLVA